MVEKARVLAIWDTHMYAGLALSVRVALLDQPIANLDKTELDAQPIEGFLSRLGKDIYMILLSDGSTW